MGQQEGDELDRELADAEVAGDDGFEDDEDMLDKMSSSPSIADEDIDFEMVYALHHFNATVEGQANAAKGEHMVLLDDSNSYWWLVRIVRDSSIGYLPAEHIETPTERLARLNKHRNIDLAANMLSDSVHEKSRNPLKKAMRRRNAKTVQFTDPIYHEASEYEYSSEEEEGAEGAEGEGEDDGNIEVHDDADEAEGSKAAGPVKRDSGEKDRAARPTVSVLNPPGSEARVAEAAVKRESEEGVKLRPNPTPSAIRHPDSAIFRDENTGTKKLTLTPNLLRDDDIVAAPTKPEVIKGGRVSLDREGRQSNRAEDVISPPTTHKTATRLRKGSVLGNLFKKRNKKGRKDEEEEVEEWLQSAAIGGGGSQEKQSIDSSRSASQDSPNGRGEETRKDREDAQIRDEQRRQQERQRQQREREQREREAKGKQAAATTAGTIRRVDSETKEAQSPISEPRQRQQQQAGPSGTTPVEDKRPEREQLTLRTDQTDRSSPITSPTETNSQHQSYQSYQPYRQRLSEDSKPGNSPQRYQSAQQDYGQERERAVDRLSESPEQITFHDAAERPDLLVDTSSGAESNDTPSPINSTPEMIDRSSTFDTTTTSPGTGVEHHTITRTWSDWSLRTYFEDDNDVRDMLIVVQQDKGDVPQQKQHPQIAPLFAESSRRLEDITKQLDGMLGEWMQRRRARA
ncbi:hypothetical protein BZA05DRAFT_427310 [Tricharina praecox]|uniref:uncharacterized protein n=1 Tax=Tricharina praecox TaxID=43433 RepID=UPI00221E6CF2|nr:uncharacterized protein BZA05DRAFT_427310 [Tricharina praecox]KAI5843673.1 hypothetical protein BZA05DRAFT_427310 [Tricharina praecox]